jgi:hypothetical protein
MVSSQVDADRRGLGNKNLKSALKCVRGNWGTSRMLLEIETLPKQLDAKRWKTCFPFLFVFAVVLQSAQVSLRFLRNYALCPTPREMYHMNLPRQQHAAEGSRQHEPLFSEGKTSVVWFCGLWLVAVDVNMKCDTVMIFSKLYFKSTFFSGTTLSITKLLTTPEF